MAKHDELEVHDDPGFQHREWVRERIAWTAMALVVVAAVFGLFGHGLFSPRTVSERSGFSVTYERIARRGGPTDLILAVDPRSVPDDRIQIRVSARYLGDLDIEAITPEPARSVSTTDGVVYEFDLSPGTASGGTEIRFDLRPDDLWSTGGQIELIGHSTVHIDQFLLP